MTSKQQSGISLERVRGSPSVNVDSLACSICHDMLWQPVACQSCETPFCSPCINQWLIHNPNKCPNRCETYMERRCPPFIAKLLAQLQISCFYQSNGCEQVLPYEALDKHEIECNYQLLQCPGCQSQLLKKDFVQHESDCPLVEWTCQDCKLIYKKADVAEKHTEIICLKEQLRQLCDESKQNRQELLKLTSQWNRLCSMNPELTKVTIKFDDLPSAIEQCKVISNMYRGLKWTAICYGHEIFLKSNFPNSGYAISFTTGDSSQIAFLKVDASIEIDHRDEVFSFISVTACAAWNDDLQLTIVGYRNTVQINTCTTTLLFGQPKLILLQWKNINKVTFKPSGGTAHPGSGEIALPHVIVTQVTINSIG